MCQHDLNTEIHDDHLKQDAFDSHSAPLVGEKRWIILTNDKSILTDPREFKAFSEATTATFIIYAFDQLLQHQVFPYFEGVYPKICRALDRHGQRGIFTSDKSCRVLNVNLTAQRKKSSVDGTEVWPEFAAD